jgi:hypothetical protein
MFRRLAAIPLLGTLLFVSACEKSQSPAPTPADPAPPAPTSPPPAPTAEAPSAPAPQPTAAPQLDNPQVALERLTQSSVRVDEGKGSCSLLKTYETVGKVVEQLRTEATESSVRCEAKADSKTWSCKADFKVRSGEGPEAAELLSLDLQYDVDGTTQDLQPGSLVCNIRA